MATLKVVVGIITCYVVACKSLRYLRRNRKHAEMPYKTREDFKNMTAEHAWQIVDYCMSLEFPLLAEKALAFALFRTYGIPTISKLLCQTQQLSEQKYAARRYTETGILIGEFTAHSPTSERANAALARMNFLHSRYQKAGRISNDDMLYTLALFILEVERWIGLYEWRTLTAMEICAFGTHWKAIGDAMGIQYDGLAHGPTAFKDGYEFFYDVQAWAAAYEERCMLPNKCNWQLAEETVKILNADIPHSVAPHAKQVVISLMDPRLRKAMLYEDPPAVYPRVLFFILAARRFVLRYLMLPRLYYFRVTQLTDKPDPKTGRYYRLVWDSEPWYVRADFWARNSPSAWFRWAVGRPYPDGKQYKPEGYSIFEVGPAKMEGLGVKECTETFERLMGAPRGACPFAFKS